MLASAMNMPCMVACISNKPLLTKIMMCFWSYKFVPPTIKPKETGKLANGFIFNRVEVFVPKMA